MQVSRARLWSLSLAALAAIFLWDLSGLDMRLAQLAGGVGGFPLRDNWFLSAPMHAWAKYAGWLFEIALCLCLIWPVGIFARVRSSRRAQAAVTVVLASGLVTLLKGVSQTSCPWDLHEFGGVARHLSHWSGWLMADGGGGHCFPAGHASTGFAFLGGYFAFRHDLPKTARIWLIAALATGLVLGAGQQLRGAHFMSHTLWTGWLCWMVALVSDPLFVPARRVSVAEVTA
jgi:membrane-associated PAP2 superfamily phosphatase